MVITKRWVAVLLMLVLIFLMVSCEDEKDDSWAEDNYETASSKDGGQLYDKWWKVNGGTEPAATFDLYTEASDGGGKTGSTTWRCKECHGWDYIGDQGRYSSGSHYTGFSGVYVSRTKSIDDIFDAIKDDGGDHDLSSVLSDEDVLDLTKFVREGLVDISLYLGSDGTALGDAAAGATLYAANCAACHGADGKLVTTFDGVGYLANDNPQETLHKIRWGHPGSAMPSAVADGDLTDAETGDILAYAQTLPEAVHYATVNWDDANLKNGGLLYDKWWKMNGVTEPTTTFSLYSDSSDGGEKTGSTTWRCKECHGWDYIGDQGRYSSGSHYTDFDGLLDNKDDAKTAIFDAILDAGGVHDLSAVLDNDDALDLTKFVVDGLVDMSLYFDSNGLATGDTTAGETLYTANCVSCHGVDGKQITTFDGVGYLSVDNPQETLHKIRWGHPGSAMPSGVVDGGLTDTETGDILAHAQTLDE